MGAIAGMARSYMGRSYSSSSRRSISSMIAFIFATTAR